MRKVLAALLLVLAACGGGGDDDDTATGESDAVTSTTAAPDDETSDGATDAGDGVTTTQPATDGPASPSTTVAATGGTDASPAAAGPQPIAAGTYRYKQSGRASGGGQTRETPPEGRAVVDAPAADGTQVVHRYIDPDGEPQDTTFRFGADGMFILKTVIRQGGAEISCTFDPPVATPPWPPTVGATYGGTGECGAFTVSVDGKVTGTRTVALDGRSYDAFVLESSIATEGQFESNSTQVDWFVPELRLSAHTETNSTGKFGQVSFESSGTSDLISAVPA